MVLAHGNSMELTKFLMNEVLICIKSNMATTECISGNIEDAQFNNVSQNIMAIIYYVRRITQNSGYPAPSVVSCQFVYSIRCSNYDSILDYTRWVITNVTVHIVMVMKDVCVPCPVRVACNERLWHTYE